MQAHMYQHIRAFISVAGGIREGIFAFIRVLQGVAVCCSVLQCVAVCCSVLQGVAVCCSVLQGVAECYIVFCNTRISSYIRMYVYIHM